MLRRGSLSLYASEKGHTMYSNHIVAEQYMTEFKEGKGERKFWHKVGPDNHWLDATYMAAAAAEAMGIRLLAPSEVKVEAQPKPEKRPAIQHGQRFKQRPGGWVAGLRNRGEGERIRQVRRLRRRRCRQNVTRAEAHDVSRANGRVHRGCKANSVQKRRGLDWRLYGRDKRHLHDESKPLKARLFAMLAEIGYLHLLIKMGGSIDPARN